MEGVMQDNAARRAAVMPAFATPAFVAARVDEYYRERVEKTWSGGHIMRGRVPGPDAVRLVSNDYLSIADHPDIVDAQIRSLRASGNGVLMSAVFVHGDDPLLDLERELADFLGSEAAVLSQSGWCANTGLIQTIADAETPVYVDMLAHMSLHEGVRAAGARPVPFRHNDVGSLSRQIARHGTGVILVDSVYSTTGSVAPLADLVEVAHRSGCVLVVDESHSLGTHGPQGAGMVVDLGLAEQVHFRTASLAKAFAGRAGVLTCSARFADYFKCAALPAIFSSALLPHEIAGLRTTIDVIRRESWRRERLHRNAQWLRGELDALGYNVSSSDSQIIPLEAGPEPNTIVLRDALERRGVFGAVFCAPATAANRSMIRLSVNAGLNREALEQVAAVCADIRDEIDLESWPSTRRRGRLLCV
jgi:CAI-1 autoinducer synthase